MMTEFSFLGGVSLQSWAL